MSGARTEPEPGFGSGGSVSLCRFGTELRHHYWGRLKIGIGVCRCNSTIIEQVISAHPQVTRMMSIPSDSHRKHSHSNEAANIYPCRIDLSAQQYSSQVNSEADL